MPKKPVVELNLGELQEVLPEGSRVEIHIEKTNAVAVLYHQGCTFSFHWPIDDEINNFIRYIKKENAERVI